MWLSTGVTVDASTKLSRANHFAKKTAILHKKAKHAIVASSWVRSLVEEVQDW